MNYGRKLSIAVLLGATALFAGCTTTPAAQKAPEQTQLALPRSSEGTLDFVAKLAKLELENKNLRMVGMLKMAEDSKSDFVKGFVAAQLGAGESSGGGNTGGVISSLMRTATDMRRLEIADEAAKREHDARYGFGQQSLQWGRLGLDYLGLRFGFRERMGRMASEDNRYGLTLNALGGAYQSGYSFGSDLFQSYDNRVGQFIQSSQQQEEPVTP